MFIDEYPKPRIIEDPASQMSIKGYNVSLICRATSTANAPIHFTWKHNNVEWDSSFQSETARSDRGITEASSTLHITNITHANAGRYQCMVTNNYGTTYSAKAKISVLSMNDLAFFTALIIFHNLFSMNNLFCSISIVF